MQTCSGLAGRLAGQTTRRGTTERLHSWQALSQQKLRRHKPGSCYITIAAAKKDAEAAQQQPILLSDLIAFQSKKEAPESGSKKTGRDADELIQRATNALDAARLALEKQQERTPSRPIDSVFTYASNRNEVKAADRDTNGGSGSKAATRSLLQSALANSSFDEEDFESSTGTDSANMPAWAVAMPGEGRGREPQLQKQEQSSNGRQLDFAEPSLATFEFVSQDALDVEAAKSAILPPFQSVLELTSAAAPPQRGEEPVHAATATSSAGRALQDGEGKLADGTRFKRESGETKGKNGYWYRWTKLSGISPAGQVEWEEKWWEASDWAGMKELGAEKSGCRADGAAWRETWREAIGFDSDSGEPMVERSAHKWAQDAKGDEWEEKWGEHYWSKGKAHKWADKWGKEGVNVWHERWGEDYPPGGDACFKYTDKWAERGLEGGAVEQWGENWEEDFSRGKGSKKGETWSVDGGGNRYQRWWGENHFGNGWVQKYGNSTTGEQWDVSEQMDTYYNPIPHFGYRLALDHSPTLKNVPTQPRAGDDIGEGIASL